MFSWFTGPISRGIVRYLQRTSPRYEPFSITDPADLRACLQPGDVLLVEGNNRISAIIKYLTQSTWSHSAIYVGDVLDTLSPKGEPLELIEASVEDGVNAVPLSKHARFNTRICRPIGLNEDDRKKVVSHAVANLGKQYDVRNIVDLMRYLFPSPPVPVRWRRRMLSLGSGDPTRAICSTFIAQAFQFVRYPILPHIEKQQQRDQAGKYLEQEIFHIKHHSLFTPRDFDVSPYFSVVKPTIEKVFDYKKFHWKDQDGDIETPSLDGLLQKLYPPHNSKEFRE